MNELKKLAKEMVWVTDELEKETLNSFEREELRAEHGKITMEVVRKGYSADLFLQYMEEYRELKLGEYGKWIND
jgi:hypothetical protein